MTSAISTLPIANEIVKNQLSSSSSSNSPSPTYLFDAFTDTNGTTITSHIMDVGSGWTVSGGSWSIQSNQLNHVGSVTPYADIITADSGHTDVTAKVDFTPKDNSNYSELLIRYLDSNNYLAIAVKAGTGNADIQIFEVASSVFTVLAENSTASISIGTTYTMQIIATGSNITARILQGVTQLYQLTATSGNNLTNTKCGMRGAEVGAIYDNFSITSGFSSSSSSSLSSRSSSCSSSSSHSLSQKAATMTIDLVAGKTQIMDAAGNVLYKT